MICALRSIGPSRQALRLGGVAFLALAVNIGAGAVVQAAGRTDASGDDTLPGIVEPSAPQESSANRTPDTVEALLPLARRGDADAANKLGVLYLAGRSVPKDVAEGLKWVRAAADKGHRFAQLNLGNVYNAGYGVPKDYGEAAKWYRLAADQDVAAAQTALGYLYERGTGVAQNYGEALSWYHKAVDHGDLRAQFNLAMMYDRGEGVTKDQAEAVRLMRTSATKGYAAAQVTLAAHYLGGNGVGRDPSRAYFWGVLGAAHVPAAQTALANAVRDAAARQLAPDEVSRIQGLAEQWKTGTDEAALLGAELPSANRSTAAALAGTGFLITSSGFAVTNAHVVPGCTSLAARGEDGTSHKAKLVTRDERNDLALVKIDGAFAHVATFREDHGMRQGDQIIVYGFPLVGVLSTQGNVTTGTISALTGLANDSRFLQISAPLQPGNSGGPVVDRSGNLVGVAVAKLNALALAKATGDVPQNVNFAIKESVVRDFLDANNIAYGTAKSTRPVSTADLAARMKAYTVLVTCGK